MLLTAFAGRNQVKLGYVSVLVANVILSVARSAKSNPKGDA